MVHQESTNGNTEGDNAAAKDGRRNISRVRLAFNGVVCLGALGVGTILAWGFVFNPSHRGPLAFVGPLICIATAIGVGRGLAITAAVWGLGSQRKMTGLLLAKGADINARDVSGKTALHHCAARYQDCSTSKAMSLLLRHGADLNRQDNAGRTPLMLAARASGPLTVKSLLDAGADTSLKDKNGKSALDYAKERHHKAIIALLSDRG